MLRIRTLFTALAIVGGMSLAATAQAGLLPVNVTVLPEATNSRWTYSIVIPTDQYITSGDYFTIYDFDGLVDGSIMMPEGWTVEVNNIGKTPSLTTPLDNELIENLSFTYTGDPQFGQAGAGNFSAASEFSQSADGMFTSRTHRNSDGRTEDSITFTDVPRPNGGTPANTPEPATLALMGIGIPVAGAFRWLRKKKS